MNPNQPATSPHFKYQILDLSDITDRYVNWLNSANINQFLEVRHSRQTKNSIIEYVSELRAKENCQIYSIKTRDIGLHIGNVTITHFNTSTGEATYGLMIGEEKYMGFAGAEASLFIIHKIFSDERIQKLNQGAMSNNFRAISLLKSLGFIENSIQLIADETKFNLTRDRWESKSALLARKLIKL